MHVAHNSREADGLLPVQRSTCGRISEKIGVPVGSFYVRCNGKVWTDGMDLQSGIVLQMGGTRPALVNVPGHWTCTARGMEGAGRVNLGAFDAWLPSLKAMLRMPPGLLGRASKGRGRIPGNLLRITCAGEPDVQATTACSGASWACCSRDPNGGCGRFGHDRSGDCIALEFGRFGHVATTGQKQHSSSVRQQIEVNSA